MPGVFQLDEIRPTASAGALDPNLLDTAERTFRLLCEGPSPLAVDGKAIGHGLPARPIPLTEPRVILLHPSAGHEARDAVWRELITKARTYGEAWTVGCVGVALPGLRRVAAGLSQQSWAADADDIAAEVVMGFTQALAHVNLDRPRIMLRLCRAARAACLRSRYATAGAVPVCLETTDGVPIKPHGGHPDLLLADAVEQGIVTRFEAQLIGTTRLEDVSLTELADHLGIDYEVLRKRRRRAETRLAEAIADGRISAKIDG